MARLSKWGGCCIGLYAEGTHRVMPIPSAFCLLPAAACCPLLYLSRSSVHVCSALSSVSVCPTHPPPRFPSTNPECRVHHPSINRAVEVISRATEAMKTRAFDQDQMDGALRYIQVGTVSGGVCFGLLAVLMVFFLGGGGVSGGVSFGLCGGSFTNAPPQTSTDPHTITHQCAVERRTGKVQLTLVWNAPGRKEAGAELARLLKAIRAADPTNVREGGTEREGREGRDGSEGGRCFVGLTTCMYVATPRHHKKTTPTPPTYT